MDSNLAAAQEAAMDTVPAVKAFIAWTLEDCLEGRRSAFAVTRSVAAKDRATESGGVEATRPKEETLSTSPPTHRTSQPERSPSSERLQEPTAE
jgi:hypothetical protein